MGKISQNKSKYPDQDPWNGKEYYNRLDIEWSNRVLKQAKEHFTGGTADFCPGGHHDFEIHTLIENMVFKEKVRILKICKKCPYIIERGIK